MFTKSDKSYLEGIFRKIDARFNKLEMKVDLLGIKIERLETVSANMVGEIQDMREELTVVSQHSIENFETNEHQDKRLTHIETHLGFQTVV